MRTVLVCVRTPLAAQHIASAAARLGLSPAVRTAVSDPEAMLRLAERPVDVVLADTALTRPDSAGFVRRVLARAPRAAVLLLGVAEPGAAATVINAGARGLIQGADHDLASAVAKALLLLAAPSRPGRRSAPVGGTTALSSQGEAGRPAAEPTVEVSRPAAEPRAEQGRVVPPAVAAWSAPVGGPGSRPGDGTTAPTVVPVQRGDDATDSSDAEQSGSVNRRALGGRVGTSRSREKVTGGEKSGVSRSVALTERELQVLLGMADGKSNAEIGRELFVSEDTVKTHARRLFRKLGARDRAHAVAAGFRAGLVA